MNVPKTKNFMTQAPLPTLRNGKPLNVLFTKLGTYNSHPRPWQLFLPSLSNSHNTDDHRANNKKNRQFGNQVTALPLSFVICFFKLDATVRPAGGEDALQRWRSIGEFYAAITAAATMRVVVELKGLFL
jgi:hypothetical protein